MSPPDSAPLETLSLAELRDLVGTLVAKVADLGAANAALKAENQALRDEVARLKGLPPRPPSRPSGMEQATGGAGPGKGGSKLKVGIRPDNVVSPQATARGESATVEVKVELVEPLGNEVIVHSRLAENPLVFRLPPQHMPETGAKMQVVVELESLHLFDAETEQRLSA